MEGLGEVGWERVGGYEGVSGDVDSNGAVAACSVDQASDGPTGGGLQPTGHGQGGGDDGQVGLDGLAQVGGRWGVLLGRIWTCAKDFSMLYRRWYGVRGVSRTGGVFLPVSR